ncbi:MAG TPA: hypothetical protein PKH77_00460 [Anaerolineae bacterium]|nr:hypothetical protein [Anaerolineae bacterium]
MTAGFFVLATILLTVGVALRYARHVRRHRTDRALAKHQATRRRWARQVYA